MSRKLLAAAEPLLFDFRYPAAYLFIWYDSYQKIMRWIGAVAAGMLTFTITFVFRDSRDAFGEGDFAGAVEALPAPNLGYFDPDLLRLSLALLCFSLLVVLCNLIVTYNWLVAGIKASIHALEGEMKSKSILGSSKLGPALQQEFHSYGAILSMAAWGRISFALGGVAGAALLVGIALYVLAALRLLAEIA